MPLTCWIVNIANIAFCGIPFLTGFYSKDLILEIILLSNINVFYVIYRHGRLSVIPFESCIEELFQSLIF